MVKSFLNAFFGGIGRTLGRIVVYILIALIFFFIYENANAMEQTGTFSITTPYDSPCGSGFSGYCAIQTNQSSYTRSLNSTYNGVLQCFSYNVHYRTESSHQYTLYIEGMDNDFRNNSLTHFVYGYNSSPSQLTSISTTMKFISKNKLSISFPSGVSYNNYSVEVCGSPLTGISNYGIKKTYFKYDDGQQDMSGIISNNNTNTDNIISNNNSNTEDIINNNNENTQDIIDSNNQNNNSNTIVASEFEANYSCGNNLISMSNYHLINNATWKYISSGSDFVRLNAPSVGSSATFPLGYSFNVTSGKFYYISFDVTNNNNNFYQIYLYKNGWTNTIYKFFDKNTNNIYFTADYTGSMYFHLYMLSNNKANSDFYLRNLRIRECVNRVDGVTGAIDDLNSSINDNSDADTSIFSTWWSNFNPLSNPIGDVITLPITLAQKIVGFNSSSCSSINLGALFGTSLILPCFSLSSVLPDNASTLITTIDVIMSISLLVVIIKNTYETIANLISLGGENKVKSHFRLPTPLEFMSSLLNGNGYSEYVDYR